MTEWFKTNFPGVRYRKHPIRKHGIKKDQYFTIRYKINGKDKEEGLGWASEKMTSEKAYTYLNELKKNIKKGEGPQTLHEKREIEKARREKEKSDKERLEKENVTFANYFENTYHPISMTSKTGYTAHKEKEHFNNWLKPILGHLPLKDIKPFIIEKLKKKMIDAGRSPRTIQHVFSTFRLIWNMARREGVIAGVSPTCSVKVPKFDNRRQRFLSHKEADALIQYLKSKDEQTYRMALLSLHTGMRASEIFKLTWGCVDIERKIITILDAKSGKGRAAFMTDIIKAMFSGMTRGRSEDLVFPNCKVIRHNFITEIPQPFRKAVKDLGFNNGVTDPRQRVCFHTLRHTFGSWHAESGTDLYVIKELLGHGSITLTERYSHLSPETLKNATKNLERSIDGARQDETGQHNLVK
jgi:integrase